MTPFRSGFADELLKVAGVVLVKVAQDPIETSTNKPITGKKSQPQSEEKQDEGMSAGNKAQAGAVGAAAASPFAGMIGQKRLQHDPTTNKKIKRFKNPAELQRYAQPGDIIITSKPGKGPWKMFQRPLAGSELYHAQGVFPGRSGAATTASSGEYADDYYKKLTRKDFYSELNTINKEMKAEKYTDVVLLRPKKDLSPKELDKFLRQATARVQSPYDMDKAVGAYLKDIFVPKLKMLEPKEFAKAPGVTTIQWKSVVNDDGEKVRMPVHCKGNVCSTGPAQAFTAATKKQIIPGKRAQDILPSDFMRSDEFKPVGAVVSRDMKVPKWHGPAARAAIGAGLGTAAYAATEDPAVVAGLGGAAAGSVAAKHYYENRAKKKGVKATRIKYGPKARDYPSIKRFIDEIMNETDPKARKQIWRRFATKNLPAKAIGGAAAFATARHLLNRGKKNAEQPSAPPAAQPK